MSSNSTARNKAWRAAHPGQRAAYLRAYRAAHPGQEAASQRALRAANPGRRSAQDKARYAADPERFLQQDRAARAKDPERTRARDKVANTRNRENIRKGNANRRARIRGLFVESVDHLVVFDRDRGICQICDSWVLADEKWEIDHIHPISKGGEHSYANVQLAHAFCNRAKWAKVPA